MLHAATPSHYFYQSNTTTTTITDRKPGVAHQHRSATGNSSSIMPDIDFHSDDEDFEGGGGKTRNKSRRELPAGAVATLKAWLLSPEHFTHPYPTPQDQVMLMQKTGIDKKQLKNWFTNARRRIWKPLLKKQLEQGKLTATGTGGAVGMPGVVPGMMPPGMLGQIPGQSDQVQYQQPPMQQHVQEVCSFVVVEILRFEFDLILINAVSHLIWFLFGTCLFSSFTLLSYSGSS